MRFRKIVPLFTRRRIMVAMLVCVTLVVLWLVASWAVAYRLTRRPTALFAEPAPTVDGWHIESPPG